MWWIAVAAMAWGQPAPKAPVDPSVLLKGPAPLPLPSHVDVLFIGNSYSYGIPGLVESLSTALGGPRIRPTSHLHGGYTLRQHLKDGHLPALFANDEPWEFVVIQEHSTLGVGYADAATGTLSTPGPYRRTAGELVGLIRAAKAQPVIYATWAKKAFPDQAGPLREAFATVATETKALTGPAGLAWEEVARERPDLELFADDGAHASTAGIYLNACVLYVSITGNSVEGAPSVLASQDPSGRGALISLSEDTARYLQTVATRVALAERW